MADEDTVTCFKLAGLEYAYTVKSSDEAEKCIREFLEETDFAVIITTHSIANLIHATINEIIEEKKHPLIVSIPELGTSLMLPTDPIIELIKRKTGIELKIWSKPIYQIRDDLTWLEELLAQWPALQDLS